MYLLDENWRQQKMTYDIDLFINECVKLGQYSYGF